jgi:hypothetical protein
MAKSVQITARMQRAQRAGGSGLTFSLAPVYLQSELDGVHLHRATTLLSDSPWRTYATS